MAGVRLDVGETVAIKDASSLKVFLIKELTLTMDELANHRLAYTAGVSDEGVPAAPSASSVPGFRQLTRMQDRRRTRAASILFIQVLRIYRQLVDQQNFEI
jgi:hypothetical protein